MYMRIIVYSLIIHAYLLANLHFQEGERPVQPHRCGIRGVAELLQRQQPQLNVQLAEGPRRASEGMAWLGHTWHDVNDEAGRYHGSVSMQHPLLPYITTITARCHALHRPM
jgi:hypothetical protein